jgi:pimeloyl-ACP methyl ester carboxylesterase
LRGDAPREEGMMSEAVTPYTIDVPETDLEDLAGRLARTRWPDAETSGDGSGPNWDQGIPLAYVRELAEHWAKAYDWRRAEAMLNGWDGFVTDLDGPGGDLPIHFLHVRSKHDDALPLVMTHGWPGSIAEFSRVIAPLTDPAAHGGDAADAFHLVIPALPGFGFSGKPTTTGWSVEAIATAWTQLMGRLGYERFGAQGGDWGSIVTHALGIQRPEGLVGIHVNMPIVMPDPDTMDSLTEAEQSALAGLQYYQDWDSGYSKQQSTRPQTLGYGLADSPVGQMAWIVEKFHRWMDCDGHPENVLTKDELLDNVMLYWLTDSGASSGRIYWESFGAIDRSPIEVPAGISVFPKEIFRCSKRWAEQRFTDLRHFGEPSKGGHFAAFEQPATFVDEVRAAFRSMR